MQRNKKESSLLFSLKELKEIEVSEVSKDNFSSASKNKTAAKKRSTSKKGPFDDTSSLLADLLDETKEAATKEHEAVQSALRSKEEEERIRRQQMEEQRRSEAQKRREEEFKRQRELEEKRLARLRERELAERRARGELVDDPKDVKKGVGPVISPLAPPPEKRSPLVMYGSIAAGILLVAGAALFLLLRPQPTLEWTQSVSNIPVPHIEQSKETVAAPSINVDSAGKSIAQLGQEAEKKKAEEEEAKKKLANAKKGKRGKGKRGGKKAASKDSDKPKVNINKGVFSGDTIVK